MVQTLSYLLEGLYSILPHPGWGHSHFSLPCARLLLPGHLSARARDWLVASSQTLASSSSLTSGACARVRRLAGCGFYEENERSARRLDLIKLAGGSARRRPKSAPGGQGSSQAAARAPPA